MNIEKILQEYEERKIDEQNKNEERKIDEQKKSEVGLKVLRETVLPVFQGIKKKVTLKGHKFEITEKFSATIKPSIQILFTPVPPGEKSDKSDVQPSKFEIRFREKDMFEDEMEINSMDPNFSNLTQGGVAQYPTIKTITENWTQNKVVNFIKLVLDAN